MSQPGRSCPAGYGYSLAAIRSGPVHQAETLYVVGGLYGNEPALDAVEGLAQAEPGPVTLFFNGDFNWFNVDAASFRRVNECVLGHGASLGNVEYELALGDGAAGCGCAYPDSVDAATVDRSNRIHQRLRETAAGVPEIRGALGQLPRWRRFQVGALRLAVVHGDAESLAGWRFCRESLDDPRTMDWLDQAFRNAAVEGFASSHTCLPVCRQFAWGDRQGFVINNGAAGMPNFADSRCGVVTRVGTGPSPHRPLYGLRLRDVFIDAIPVEYDHERWSAAFLANWPVGSPAWISYWPRLVAGPQHTMAQAAPDTPRPAAKPAP